MDCLWCNRGEEPALLDVDGVRCDVSGNLGCWAHSHEDGWWPCARKAAEEHAKLDWLRAVCEIAAGDLDMVAARLRRTALGDVGNVWPTLFLASKTKN